MSAKHYTTMEAADMAHIPRATLQYWIATGKVNAPPVKRINGKKVRQWTAAQIKQLATLRTTLQSSHTEKRRVNDHWPRLATY